MRRSRVEEERNDGRGVWGRTCRWQHKMLAPALGKKDLEGECWHLREATLREGRMWIW